MKTEYRIVLEDSMHSFGFKLNELAGKGFVVDGGIQATITGVGESNTYLALMKKEFIEPQERARSWIQVQSQWVDTKIRMPDLDTRVLVKAMGGKVVISKLGHDLSWHDDDGGCFNLDTVKEWMELPK